MEQLRDGEAELFVQSQDFERKGHLDIYK